MPDSAVHTRNPTAEFGMIRVFILSAGLILTGCTTRPVESQAELFRERGRAEAADYEILAPVSVESMEYFMRAQYDTVDAFLDGFAERIHEPVELQRYLRDLREINESTRLDRDPEWAEFVERVRSGDELYLFEFHRPYRHEFGLLVLRDGEIVFRTVWESASPGALGTEGVQDPEVDRL